MRPLSLRSTLLNASLTVNIDTKAKQLRADGVDVISLGAGEPDFDTPEYIKQAAHQHVLHGNHSYTAPQGIQALREAICRKHWRDEGIQYEPQQIVVTSGAKHAVFQSLLSILDPGDEVLIPTPCWVTYPELVRLLGAIPIMVPGTSMPGHKVSIENLERAVTIRTKALLLNSPNNPTGAVLDKTELQAIGDFVLRHDLYCLSDEIYGPITYDVPHISIASLSAELQERTLLVHGVSKAYAMTGWRLGWIATSTVLAATAAKCQGQTTHHPSNTSQIAAMAALDGDQTSVAVMANSYRERRDFVLSALRQIDNISIDTPQGAFYVLPDIRPWLGKATAQGKLLQNSMQLAEWLLEELHLATVPGIAFGLEGFLRLSYATSMNDLRIAMERLTKGLASLR